MYSSSESESESAHRIFDILFLVCFWGRVLNKRENGQLVYQENWTEIRRLG